MTDSNVNAELNDTESKILAAAEHEFLTKGLAGARTTTIAEAAGVTHAMLHYYFRTKKKLFDRIISEKVKLIKEILTNSIEDIDAPLETILSNLIGRHLDFIAENPDVPRFIFSEMLNDADQMKVFVDNIKNVAPRMITLLQQKIDETAEKGECRKVDAGTLMLDVISLNVFPFLASPLIAAVLNDPMRNQSEFVELRKKENLETIMRKLRP